MGLVSVADVLLEDQLVLPELLATVSVVAAFASRAVLRYGLPARSDVHSRSVPDDISSPLASSCRSRCWPASLCWRCDRRATPEPGVRS
jgi:hypothetical protein